MKALSRFVEQLTEHAAKQPGWGPLLIFFKSVGKALEADGARRLRSESFLSAPQLTRDPLGGSPRSG